MTSVRAKFKVDEIRRHTSAKCVVGDDGKPIKNEWGGYKQDPCEARTIIMSPVYGQGDPNHENTKFWQASPSGKLELCVVNLAAAEAFELGKEYYVDFTPADQ